MSRRTVALGLVLILFSALTGIALAKVGYLGILLPHFQSWGAGQVLADLVIMCTLGCIWMVRDAQQRGRRAWPFVVLILVAGSYGPLVYLLIREMDRP